MPTAAEGLTVDSSKEQRNQAISSCISQMSKERPDADPKQIQAI